MRSIERPITCLVQQALYRDSESRSHFYRGMYSRHWRACALLSDYHVWNVDCNFDRWYAMNMAKAASWATTVQNKAALGEAWVLRGKITKERYAQDLKRSPCILDSRRGTWCLAMDKAICWENKFAVFHGLGLRHCACKIVLGPTGRRQRPERLQEFGGPYQVLTQDL